MSTQYLSKKDHWDALYEINTDNTSQEWKPTNYDSKVLEYILFKMINEYRPSNILEIGCGNSTWLSYLAKQNQITIAGIDYSEKGCQLTRQRLKGEGVEGKIFCIDIFKADPQLIGQYDFVYSLGVIEHFSDVQAILEQELKFVKPGGILFTEIPNLRNSIHGLLSWIYQPQLLNMHKKISKNQLIQTYKNMEMENIQCNYLGLFSLTIVAWGNYPRWTQFSKRILPFILLLSRIIDRFLLKINIFYGLAPFAPFIYIKGRKKV